jgi:DNA-binding NarL/FixJ family response regulator
MRVIVADDSVLFREGLARLLTDAGAEVIGQAGDAIGLRRLVEADQPNLVIVDVRMPPGQTVEGLEAASDIRARYPEIGVLVLSNHVETHHAIGLLGGGAQGVGYLLKDRVASVDRFLDDARRVADGGSVIDPDVVGRLLERRRARGPLDDLTPREREVLGLMAEGRSNRAIAEALMLSEKTVDTHIAAIFGKLALEPAADDHRRVLAVLAFLQSR